MILGVVVFALAGLAAGIGVNVLSDRLPSGLGFRGLWVCHACKHPLSVSQGIGFLRELSKAGQCPACHSSLSHRHAVVELVLAGLFALHWWQYGPSLALALNSLFLAVLALIFVVDLEHRLVLNVVVAPAAGLAILAALVRSPGLASALTGGAVAFVFLLVFFLVYPQGLGAGDVKLAGFIGLLLGWPSVLPGLFVGFALGAATSIMLIITRRVGLKSYIPYAPFLAAGAYVALLLRQ